MSAGRREGVRSRGAVIAVIVVVLAAVVAAANLVQVGHGPGAPLPATLERYLTGVVKLSAAERQMLIGGAPVTKLFDVDESKEVGVFGATWVDAPIEAYVDAVKDIENFERGGGFKVTRRISDPPVIGDFADMHLSEEDVKDLRKCRVGDCELKLGEEALRRFRTEIDWTARTARTSADALMQRLALERVVGYLQGGNERLAVYRDKSRPTFVAAEFRSMIDLMPELTTYMPDMRRYLLEFPTVTLPNATSFLYWQETEFGLKPTIRISHLTIRGGEDETVVTSKMLYASHYFWTGLELRTLLPDPSRGRGFWFVMVNRSRSDGLSGFTGRIVRRRVQREVRNGAVSALRMTKRMLEAASAR